MHNDVESDRRSIRAREFVTLADAYRFILSSLVEDGVTVAGTEDPNSIGSEFGRTARPTREVLGSGFTLYDPLASFFHCERYPLNLAYVIGQFLWVLSGSDNVEWISYYNGRGPLFSDDGQAIRGAMGPRLIGGSSRYNQLAAVVDRLRRDPGTRRTTCVTLDAQDNDGLSRDYPCCVALNYFLREGRLCSITFMRSQSAFGVMPYDVGLFVLLQAWIAAKMCVPVGTYGHLCASLHVYEDEIDRARSRLDSSIRSAQFGPMLDPESSLGIVLDVERFLRSAVASRKPHFISTSLKSVLEVPRNSFWVQAIVVLILHAARCLGVVADVEHAIERLDKEQWGLIEEGMLCDRERDSTRNNGTSARVIVEATGIA